MTIKLSSLKADLAREEKGDWIEYPDWPDVAFNVSSLHLPAFVTARDLLLQRMAKKHGRKSVPREEMTAEFGKLYAEHILHDWRGIDVEYSPDAARDILSNPEYRNVVAAVEWCAAKVSDVDIQFVETASKNSARPSDGA
ncbi:hypothetical protein [Aminobacter aminovorans]|uniref:Uncharacterized protein n=1 Tax=Aminobacter aminovorans TaxID=83263 RepID=A0AAC8YN48_AMIAI|nr:hypothetical protein [Aminobacter aminovorans]AMS41156.1 hypothetical protein AA2016_2227 [Aminobacter aminovorans]MBB3705862.1 hypothetical protein [Aminobacter aminovorans]